MANGTDSHETLGARTIDVEQLMAAMPGLTQGQIEDVLQSLLAARAPLPRLFEATPPPSRRRPRRYLPCPDRPQRDTAAAVAPTRASLRPVPRPGPRDHPGSVRLDR